MSKEVDYNTISSAIVKLFDEHEASFGEAMSVLTTLLAFHVVQCQKLVGGNVEEDAVQGLKMAIKKLKEITKEDG